MKKIDLIIEKGDDGLLWGRVIWNGGIVVEIAENVNDLEIKMKILLKDFEDVDPATVGFNHLYDVYALFQRFDFLKISSVAVYAGLNPSLLRQYASGIKNPGKEQAKKIEAALHKLAAQLQTAHVYTA